MKRVAVIAIPAILGLMLGFATERAGAPLAAIAQGIPMQSETHGTHGTMNGVPSCTQMQSMMQHMMSEDRALMQPMMQMHTSMTSVQLTGNADHDFVVMMIPHHQGAIAMAQIELKYGKNAKALALAKDIISAQQEEVQEMQSWNL